jgi:hypothetical protein
VLKIRDENEQLKEELKIVKGRKSRDHSREKSDNMPIFKEVQIEET